MLHSSWLQRRCWAVPVVQTARDAGAGLMRALKQAAALQGQVCFLTVLQVSVCAAGALWAAAVLPALAVDVPSAAQRSSWPASYSRMHIRRCLQHQSRLTCAGPAASPRRLLSCCMSDLAEGRSRLCAPSRSEAGAAFRICSIGCRTKATACCSTKERTCTQQRST